MYRRIKSAADIKTTGRLSSAVAIFLSEKTTRLPAEYKQLDQQLGGVLSGYIKRDEFNGRVGDVAVLYPESGAERLFVVGLGKVDVMNGNQLRIASKALYRAVDSANVSKLMVFGIDSMKGSLKPAEFGEAVGDGMGIASFEFLEFKGAVSGSEKKNAALKSLVVSMEKGCRGGLDRAIAMNDGVSTARRLAATPPNVANVPYIERYCRSTAKKLGLKCTVINAAKAKQLGMGGLLAVGAGSESKPAIIALEWKGSDAKADPILLVGKSITFDTGGYSLKPDGGKGMKYDKCGGMTVIGIMEAVANLKLKQRVVGLIAAAENMIDSEAYRVDDIIKFTNGVTCEVTNTDAEGRLVLADALAYGTKTYKPKSVIDMATLTGGVVVALGSYCAGVFATDDKIMASMQKASQKTGEKIWRLPLWDEHRKQMSGTHADLVNSANREAHPIQGAAFLSHFVGKDAPKLMPKMPWMHIDIAGVASFDSDTALYPKGPSGWGVRLVTEYLANN
ncbi:Cytosol aminopeptidase [Poriferisphaera corsica]|uniref:Probable cytosol aminopeptidase n=1 Tax=Poriferisphaera corsica TaxID=2528020 RepID=A0A517YZ60_9BACT|nr:leucyl aminopeptidase family protein [Poriferisphaera corsica]QDU35521.1 Cytosol aminopeptidase [Poriferisphaera corsica]